MGGTGEKEKGPEEHKRGGKEGRIIGGGANRKKKNLEEMKMNRM